MDQAGKVDGNAWHDLPFERIGTAKELRRRTVGRVTCKALSLPSPAECLPPAPQPRLMKNGVVAFAIRGIIAINVSHNLSEDMYRT